MIDFNSIESIRNTREKVFRTKSGTEILKSIYER